MKLLIRILLAVVALAAVVYLSDYAILRYRISANRNAFGAVTVQPYYAIKQKNGKTEFVSGDSQNVSCVNSLFPHSGYVPCWYLNRHSQQQVNL
jgi:hypothetical protein